MRSSLIRNLIQIVGIVTLCLLISNIVFAVPPDSPGRIVFLGKTSDEERSVWLSLTTEGMFEIESRKLIVDEWSQSEPGLHGTLSPVVSNGSGDPHSLFQVVDGELILIDKDNQQGGITFPPLPGGLPPGEVTLPIILPGEPTHPIILPGEPTHPIIKPGQPTHPIILPGQPTHPIIKPGQPTHPIILPGQPTHPIIKPGEPTHPIIKPGQPTHPIELPSEGSPPSLGSSSGETPISATESHLPATETNVDNLNPNEIIPSTSSSGADSNSNTLDTRNIKSGASPINKAPLSPGRQFAKEPLLNFWADERVFRVNDHRFGLDRKGNTNNITVGVDRRINNVLIIGAMAANDKGRSSCFDNTWQSKARGITYGPYFGYKFLPNWVINGTVGYGRYKNRNNIAILNSKYITTVYSSSLNATGIYNVKSIELRVKPAIYYNYFRNAAYSMNGKLNGFSFSVPIASYKFPFGFSQFAVEALHSIQAKNDKIKITPYLELGVNYAFVRPNGGQILSGDLIMRNTPPWSGLARLGVRTFLSESFFFEMGANYLSLGQPHLNVWMGRIFLSWAIK